MMVLVMTLAVVAALFAEAVNVNRLASASNQTLRGISGCFQEVDSK